MKIEEFISRHAKTIAALWSEVAHRYGVSEHEFAERLRASAVRCLAGDETDEVAKFLAHIKAGELCLVIACERGDEAAWRDFETGYRYAMNAAARGLTKDEAEAEDLVQSLFGELFGVRTTDERRGGKFAHYSGRGSLGGWLR